MNRIKLNDSVYLTSFDAQQFKRCSITVQLTMPSERETATAHALLPLVMERGYEDYPDMTELSKHLASLYGASLSVHSNTSGANRVFSVNVCGIKDELALEGENLSQEYTKLALDVLFRPYFENNMFSKTEIEIEKMQLKAVLESEINEKRAYCISQARRVFFGDSPAGIESNGYLEEVDGITPEKLTQVYQEMLQKSHIEIMALGADEESVKQSVQVAMQNIKRKPVKPSEYVAMPYQEEVVKNTKMETEQGKLCMIFTTNDVQNPQEIAAYRIALTIFGSSPTSRLFVNVREKYSLCYYCAARFMFNCSAMVVDSGVEHKNAKAAKEAILTEIEAMQNGEITNEDLDNAKRFFTNNLRGVLDSIGGIHAWYASEIERGTNQTPQQAAEDIQKVTAQQVQEIMQKMKLSVTYTLTNEEV